MTGERTLETVVGWNLTRFDYTGAHVEAYRSDRNPPAYLENDGQHITLTSEESGGHLSQSVSIPIVVIRRVLELDRGGDLTTTRRLLNLRAALASIEARASTGSTPLCENIALAARGALEADDRDANGREFQVSPEGEAREVRKP